MFVLVFVASGENSAWCERLFFWSFSQKWKSTVLTGKMQRRSFYAVYKTSGYMYSIYF